MKISLKQLGPALQEWDFARRAATYGVAGGREVLGHAIRNLPSKELDELRPHLAAAIKSAVERTTRELNDLGVEPDEFPPAVRAGRSEPV